MAINIDKFAQQCIEAISKKIRELKTLNVMVIGKSGVGKSTLINSVFRGQFAETGLGRPVTQEIRRIVKKDHPLAIYDTPGFELSAGQQNQVKEEILDIIAKGYHSQDVNDAIHCIWYCINVGGNRTFDRSELEWLRAFSESNKRTQVPIIVVLTQAVPRSKAAEMKQLVERENLDIVKVVPLLAQDMNFDDEYIARAYGLEALIEVMTQVLPDELQTTLQNMQKASLASKRKAAQAAVATAVAASFTEGFVPVPFADAALLVPTQVGMIAAITAIFGLDVNKSLLTAFVTSTLGAGGATVVGRTIVGNLMKLLPGVGTAAGGAISGATAGLLTTALGEAYILMMEKLYKGELRNEDLDTIESKKLMQEIFQEKLRGGKDPSKKPRRFFWQKRQPSDNTIEDEHRQDPS